ncbi:hypothetical protein [Amycolatopsis nigrescens]|uniref:hypothetical protein n=1 Tax=Amycolatopsis nigrescens TaxID=381445 RepID=UPI0012FB703A|nr:hypothetical protein [Amycolatopsis nigrescens]
MRAPTREKLPALLLGLAVLLAGLGTWFAVEANAAGSFEGSDNRAQLDAARTAEVSASVTNSLNKIFSYSFDKTEVTEKAAAEALRGDALNTYNQLFAQVRTLAPQQKLVLTTRVVNSAVQSLTGDDAQLLVFLDQSAVRASDNTTNAAASQLSVTAHHQDDRWVITTLVPR